jgi:hypothetical protein
MSVSPALQDVEDLAFRRLSAFAVRRRVAQEPIQALECSILLRMRAACARIVCRTSPQLRPRRVG